MIIVANKLLRFHHFFLFRRFLDALPLPLKDTFMRRPSKQQQQQRHKRDIEVEEAAGGESETTTDSSAINCNWNIKVDWRQDLTFVNAVRPRYPDSGKRG